MTNNEITNIYRGFKSVGPFVVMIYRMIMGDLLRFVTIYVVFVMGFSQGEGKLETMWIINYPFTFPDGKCNTCYIWQFFEIFVFPLQHSILHRFPNAHCST